VIGAEDESEAVDKEESRAGHVAMILPLRRTNCPNSATQTGVKCCEKATLQPTQLLIHQIVELQVAAC
jgi:hypothetical protein